MCSYLSLFFHSSSSSSSSPPRTEIMPKSCPQFAKVFFLRSHCSTKGGDHFDHLCHKE